MNKIAIALNVVGALSILGGFAVGLSLYETPLPEYTYLTEKDYSVLIMWIAVGAVCGLNLNSPHH